MESLLHTGFAFLAALGVLIAFHEFGHYWVAKTLGVKVLRFSIGFGQPLWQRQKTPDDTEFVIAAIPLGGYVKMVDEREGPVDEADLPFAFNRQSLAIRTAIVAAGPIFNWLLAITLFWFVLAAGETGFKPILGDLSTDTLAYNAGFRSGDKLLTVNGAATPTWGVAFTALVKGAEEGGEIKVDVETQTGEHETRYLEIPQALIDQPHAFQERLGFQPWEPELPPKIDVVQKGGAADAAGLRTGDLIVQADDVPMQTWSEWVRYVRARPEQNIQTVIERDGIRSNLTLKPRAEHEAGLAAFGKIGASVAIPENAYADVETEYRLPLADALLTAISRTFEYSWLTAKTIGRVMLGQADLNNLSGPIGIAQYAGQSAKLGPVQFAKFLAIVSISLAVLNLLPIPTLDGGHLLFFLIEWVKGKPLSDETQAIYSRIGLAILLGLMSLAFWSDIQRLLT